MIITNECWTRLSMKAILGSLATLISISAFGQPPEHHWVQHSWVDVYSAPQKEAKVIGNWVANTEVMMTKIDSDWCHASTAASAASQYESVNEGYLDCRAIGDHKLTIRETEEDKLAFWIEPSVQRFARAGQSLNYSALTEKQRVIERTNMEPVRFPIPEFEAMKQRLTRGVIPNIELQLWRRDVKDFHGIRGETSRNNGEMIEYVKSLEPFKNLPSIRTSLFKHHSDVLLHLENHPDSVSAMLNKANKVTFGGKAEWVTGHHDEGVSSIWDIGRIDIKYAVPVTLHSVSRFGLVGARQLESATILPYSPAEGCQGGYPELPSGIDIAGYPRLKEHPLVAFVLPEPLPVKKLDVLTYKARVLAHTDPYSGPKNIEERTILVHAIDVNGDAIPDFSTMEIGAAGFVDDSIIISWYYHFINVSGTWWYAGSEHYEECT